MQTTTRMALSLGAICFGWAGLARADDCETVLNAYTAMSRAPAYHQTMAMPGVALEMIAIGDALYMKDGAEWMKLPVTPGMREQMMAQIMPDATALRDCRSVGSETLDGVDTSIYEYQPPEIEGAGPMGVQRVWIADADGLPRRMAAEQDGETIDIRISYEDVTPPLP